MTVTIRKDLRDYDFSPLVYGVKYQAMESLEDESMINVIVNNVRTKNNYCEKIKDDVYQIMSIDLDYV
tara:strand:+ start:466 stop:669 length:204 start_codon:yes stop_codon:yes gene_type:complete